ncbi:hypothetical protein BC833DRAFT_573470 [Globomyces pollinis-pini]|nr:hypothetical protein BC833DRAFT_573470 [Globomyces pollinis-pini]
MKGLKKTNKKKETQNIDSSPISEIFETSLDDAYLLLDLPNPNIIHNETDYDTSDSGLKYPSNDPELFHVAQILLQSSMSMDSSTDSSTSRFLDETSSVDSSDSKGKKERKKRKDPVTGRTCDYCKSTQTPLWRHGPPGYDDLCNKVNYLYPS